MVNIFPHEMSEGKIVALKIDNEIVKISPFPFDKLTSLIEKAKEYYEAKATFENSKRAFERFKSEFESFTHGSITDKEVFTAPPKSEIPDDVPQVERVIVAPPIPAPEITPEEYNRLPLVTAPEQPQPVQEHTIQSDAENIVSRVKILSILKRTGKTASKEDIKAAIVTHTNLDTDAVADKVIEILRAKGKIK